MTGVPLWMRALRWYTLHSPVQRGAYRLAAWLYRGSFQSCPYSIPDIEVETTLDRTLLVSLRLRVWVDYNMYCLGLYEAPLARFFIRSLLPESVVLDIGAYIGQYTLLAAKYAPQGHVVALEPHPESAQRLMAHIARNELKNVMVFTSAAGQRPGRLPFVLSQRASDSGLFVPGHQTSDDNVIEVKVVTVDDVVQKADLQKVDLIKIDVEGFEGQVLRGAGKTLSRYHPILFIEIDRGTEQALGDSPERISEYLRELGYSLYALRRNRLRPIGHVLPNYENVIALPRIGS